MDTAAEWGERLQEKLRCAAISADSFFLAAAVFSVWRANRAHET